MNTEPNRTWTVAEAKARLSEILRLARKEGPQRIGTKARYVIVPEEVWLKHTEPRIPLGRWLVENMPRIDDLELPDRHEPDRPSPFEGWELDDGPGGK